MSVIALISSGPGQNVVVSDEAYQAAGGLDGRTLLIRNLDPSQLSSRAAENDSNTSYDLRVGQEYRDHRDTGKTELLENQELELLPGSAVVVETEEEVRLPRWMFGHIVPKVSLLQEGISNTCSKVDPGYNGRLLVTVFNLGKRTISFKRGDRFCSLYLVEVGTGSRPYNKTAKRIMGVSKGHRMQKMVDWIEAHAVLMNLPWIILSSVLSSVLTWYLTRGHGH